MAKKNLISLVKVLVKPQHQNNVLYRIINSDFDQTIVLDETITVHNIEISFKVKREYFDKTYDYEGWNKYPKFKPIVNGVYRIRFENGAEYFRRSIDGTWYDITGTVKSRTTEPFEFKWYASEL